MEVILFVSLSCWRNDPANDFYLLARVQSYTWGFEGAVTEQLSVQADESE